ncbi:MAG TPA: polysaccharide deacetylase family protein [Dehalococcoidia bacterium]|nr:polysaccharide deacetylase family protein [Dehalococcoidia bacterium]
MTITDFWPPGSQAAAAISVNLEAESVDRRESELPLWGRRSHGRYAAQAGAFNLLDLFERQSVHATFFINGWDARRYPALMERIAAAGHEVAASGCLHEDFSALSAEQQHAVLEQSEAALNSVFGSRPAGFRAPDRLMTSETHAVLAARGYAYDSSCSDDDVPYVIDAGQGRSLLEIPVQEPYSDRCYYEAHRTPAVVRSALADLFDAAYDEGALFTLMISPRGDVGSGRGLRARVVESVIQAMKERPRLWLATCGDLAGWMQRTRGPAEIPGAAR